MKRKHPKNPVSVRFHPDAATQLEAELDPGTAADVHAAIARLDGKTQPEIVKSLDPRTEPKVYQMELYHHEGALRVVFAWGKGCLWFIGAFVKHNDAEGKRFMRKILPRARQVANWGTEE